MTFSVIYCTVAVGDAAKNYSNSAQNVCRKKAAQISLVEIPQLEDILWFLPIHYNGLDPFFAFHFRVGHHPTSVHKCSFLQVCCRNVSFFTLNWLVLQTDCYDLTRKEITSAYLATGNGSRNLPMVWIHSLFFIFWLFIS